jgi:hypothetical protein
MTADLRRIRAVAASLRSIRDRVNEFGDVEEWDTAAFDNAVLLLDGAIENTDFSSYLLELTECPARDYLVHLDSLIAFLEVYEKEAESSGGILSFPSRKG